MRGSWPVVGLVALLVAGCLPTRGTTLPLEPQTELERTVASAGLEAWRAAGLETTPAVRDVMRLRIERLDAGTFDVACPDAWACLGWRDQGAVLVVYLSPRLPAGNVLHAALHELCHAMGYRFGRWGDYNAGHTDAEVFAGKGGSRPNSVEQRAQRALDH